MLGCCRYNYSKLCTGHLLLSYFNRDINLNIHFHQRGFVQPSHVLTITDCTIQYGVTALQQASKQGHQKVVELLLGAGAKPDLQDKVGTGWDSA